MLGYLLCGMIVGWVAALASLIAGSGVLLAVAAYVVAGMLGLFAAALLRAGRMALGARRHGIPNEAH